MPAAGATAMVEVALRLLRVATRPGSVQRHERGYRLEPRILPSYNLIYLTRGRALWIIAGVDHPLAEGDLLLVPPGVPHRARSLVPRITLGSIHVAPTLPGGQDAIPLLGLPRLRRVPAGSRLDGYLRHMMGEWTRPGDEAAGLQGPWGELIVRELIRHDAAAGLLAGRTLEPTVATVIAALDARLDRPTTLADLARLAGYTPQHLNRLFRRAVGATPLRILLDLRLARAAELLAHGPLTIEAVARAVGFADPAYFSRRFRAHHGLSPRQWRERS